MVAAEETFFPIREISTYQARGWKIKARVTRKAPLRTFSKGVSSGKVFSVDLLDADGGEIRASFFNSAVDAFLDTMVVGKCYIISNGSVRVANRQYNQCNHRYELVFDKGASVVEAGDDAKIETVKFNFVNLRALQSKSMPCIIDVCGIVTAYKPPQTIKKDTQELIKRELTVADDTANSMTIAVWNDKATQPDSTFDGNPVVAFKGVAVREWSGGRAGSLTQGGGMEMNSTLPEAQRLREWWKQGGESQNITTISREGGGGGMRLAQIAKDATFAELRILSQKVVDQTEAFNIVGRLSNVQFRKQGEKTPLAYMACQEAREGTTLPCNRRLDDRGFCVTCGRAGKAAPRLNMRCKFTSFDHQAWLTTFHEAAEGVLGKSAQEVHEMELAGANEKLENVIRNKFFSDPLQLIVRAKLDTYNNETRTNLTCIVAQPVNMGQHGRKMVSDIHAMLGLA